MSGRPSTTRPEADGMAYVSSEERTFLSQWLPVEDEVRMNLSRQHIPQAPNVYNSRDIEQSTSIMGDETPHLQSLVAGIHYADMHVMCSSDSMKQTTFPFFAQLTSAPYTAPKSGLEGLEDDGPTEPPPTTDPTGNRCKDGPSMSGPRDRTHQFTRVEKTPNISVPSELAVRGILGTPTAVQNKQGLPHSNLPQQFQKTRKGRATTSPRSLRKQTDVQVPPRRRYLCNICGNDYAQPQGVTRHQREMHEASLCMYCHQFKWGRLYLLRDHLERQHPDVDPDAVVEAIKRIGCRATIPTVTAYPPISSPTREPDRRVRIESRLHPLIPPPSVVTELPSISLPAFLPVSYDPHCKFIEPTILKKKLYQMEADLATYASREIPYPDSQSGSSAANPSSNPVTTDVSHLPHLLVDFEAARFM